MADSPLFPLDAPPIVRPLRWIGLALAALVAAIGAGLGFWQSMPAQYVIFTTAATFALVLWVWNAFLRALGGGGVAARARRPPSAAGARSPRATRSAVHPRQQRRARRPRDPDCRLHHPRRDADRVLDLAEFLHRAVSRRGAGLHRRS